MTVAASVFGRAALSAQGVELSPFAGYRVGGNSFETVAGRLIDVDGAPAIGLVLDVPLSNGLQVEGLFTHQQGSAYAPIPPFGARTRGRASIDHWQCGGLQEFDGGRARPFLAGTLGLTRYAAEAENEFRFAVGAGGGVKLFPVSHFGVRLDGRLFATFNDAAASTIACSTGVCFVAVHVNVSWQAEFTAAIVVKLP